MRFSNHRYMGKILQCLQTTLGRSAIDATFSTEAYKQMSWYGNVHGVVNESPHSSGAGFPNEFRNLQEHKIRGYWECLQHHSQINKRTFRRHSECEKFALVDSSPSWTRSTLVNDQAIKWAKANYADSVLCVGRQFNSSGKISQDCRHCLFFKRSRKNWRRRTSRTGSSSCQCPTTFCGKHMMRIASLTLWKSRITRRNSY